MAARRDLKVKLYRGKGRGVSSRRWLERQLNDPYVRESKARGYRSRSAFKLIALDDRFGFLKPGGRIVDLGSAPGGWSQVAAERVGASGLVVAIDQHGMDAIAGVEILKLDIHDDEAARVMADALGGGGADVVLSDMAAHATGHRRTDHLKIMNLAEAALDFAFDVLNPDGVFVCKVLRGGAEAGLLNPMKRAFASVRHVKPDASRADSAELYIVARGYRNCPRHDRAISESGTASAD